MKMAVLGLGFMGSTHLKALQNIADAEIVAVASDDPVALSGDLSAVQGNLGTSFEKLDFSRLRKYTNYADVMNDKDVEAVDLCLPTHLHAPAAIAALRAGKHVLVEKPMGLNGAETDAMIEEADKSGRLLMTAQVLRFFPEYVALAEIVKNGMLGDVRSAVFRRRCAAPAWSGWLADPKQSGGGVFDLLIHDIDQCLHLFGKPEAISATGFVDLKKGIDMIAAELYYPEIGSVTVTGGWHHPKKYPFSMEYTVVCDGGTVEYSSAGRPPSLYAGDGTETVLPLAAHDGYAAEIAYFVDCCVNGAKPDRCPPEESAAAVKLTRLTLDAREKKGEKIPCNLS
jgi:predicted dehydrogenase